MCQCLVLCDVFGLVNWGQTSLEDRGGQLTPVLSCLCLCVQSIICTLLYSNSCKSLMIIIKKKAPSLNVRKDVERIVNSMHIYAYILLLSIPEWFFFWSVAAGCLWCKEMTIFPRKQCHSVQIYIFMLKYLAKNLISCIRK